MPAVSEYLALVRGVESSDVDSVLRRLDAQSDELTRMAAADAAHAQEALAYLAKKRLLASNTLTASNREDRLAWDRANVWLNGLLAHRRLRSEWSYAELATLQSPSDLFGRGAGPR